MFNQNYNYGISVPIEMEHPELYLGAINDNLFSYAEIDGTMLEIKNLPLILKHNNISVLNVINPIENSIMTSLYAPIDLNIKPKILELLQDRLLCNYDFDIYGFTIDFGSIHNLETINILKAIAYPVVKMNRIIYIPLNIPNKTIDSSVTALKKNILSSMLDNYKICLNIYVHEVKNTINPNDLYDLFPFDLKLIRIIYEPEIGNHLTKELLKYWLEPVKKHYSEPKNIIFCPKINSINLFEKEVASISKLISGLI